MRTAKVSPSNILPYTVSETASNLGHRTDTKQGNELEMNRSGGSAYVPSLLSILYIVVSVVHH